MMDPYAGPRAAVAAWSPASSSPAAAADGMPAAGVFAANEPAVGLYSATLGALVATYPAAGYARWLDWLGTRCTEIGDVAIYYGAIQDTSRISSYGDGSNSEFDPNRPRYIPQGAPVYVVWTVTSGTATASCMAGFREAV